MLYKICCVFLLFFIYSFLGYLVEVACCSIVEKKLVLSRGYLIGPYLPIFGFGSIFVTYYLSKYHDDLIVLFIMGMVLCCILEYFGSLILEKIFKLRWWNYFNKKFNINGRVCLETGLLFGLGSILIIKVFNPIVFWIFTMISPTMLIVIAIILFMIMFSDLVLSTFIVVRLEIDTNKYLNKDATKMVKEEARKSLKKYQIFHKRVFRAFPTIPKENYKVGKIKDIITLKNK